MTKVAKEKTEDKKPAAKEASPEKSVLGVTLPDGGEVLTFLKGVKYITPYTLSERFGVRLSIAKQALKDLASKGLIKQVVGSNRVRIYQTITAPQPVKSDIGPKPKPTKAKGKKEALA
jgi:ribosomal protein S25